MSGEKSEHQRRLSDLSPPTDCDHSQHVLYDFLRKVDSLARIKERVTDLEREIEDLKRLYKGLKDVVEELKNQLEMMRKDFDAARKEIKEGMSGVQDKVDSIDKKITPIFSLWNRAKSASVLLLGAYFLKDSPELLQLLMSLVSKAPPQVGP